MKRILCFLTVIFMAVSSYASDFLDGISYDYLYNNAQTVEVRRVLNRSYIVIPSFIHIDGKEFRVTAIGDAAFENCNNLTSVTIPNSVTTIGDKAFSFCCKLKSVTIPNSVTTIGGSAFSCCDKLKSVTIGNSVTTIGKEAFYGCYKLTSVTIPNSVTTIGKEAFYGCSSLTSIDVDSQNKHFTSVEGVLYNKDITALLGWPGGKPLGIFPNSVTKIGDCAFSGCNKLTSVTIPNSVTKIGDCVFSGCDQLTSVTIPNSVTDISSEAFLSSSLTSIDVDSQNKHFTSVEGVLYNKDITTLLCWPRGKPFGTIPNSVTKIGDCAFSGGGKLTPVTIPNSVTDISSEAFLHCGYLLSIDVDSQNKHFTSVEGALYNKDITTLLRWPRGKTLGTIPNSVITIGENAFNRCVELKSVTIPNSVYWIGDKAFSGCSSLKSVTIPDSVYEIGIEAFSGCSSLTSVTIGNSVEEIGEEAFSGCDKLRSVTCLRTTSPPDADLFTFDDSTLENAKLYVPEESLTDYETTLPWSGFFNLGSVGD